MRLVRPLIALVVGAGTASTASCFYSVDELKPPASGDGGESDAGNDAETDGDAPAGCANGEACLALVDGDQVVLLDGCADAGIEPISVCDPSCTCRYDNSQGGAECLAKISFHNRLDCSDSPADDTPQAPGVCVDKDLTPIKAIAVKGVSDGFRCEPVANAPAKTRSACVVEPPTCGSAGSVCVPPHACVRRASAECPDGYAAHPAAAAESADCACSCSDAQCAAVTVELFKANNCEQTVDDRVQAGGCTPIGDARRHFEVVEGARCGDGVRRIVAGAPFTLCCPAGVLK
jgi:hypothetical protein